jgi:hypothetical protein
MPVQPGVSPGYPLKARPQNIQCKPSKPLIAGTSVASTLFFATLASTGGSANNLYPLWVSLGVFSSVPALSLFVIEVYSCIYPQSKAPLLDLASEGLGNYSVLSPNA